MPSIDPQLAVFLLGVGLSYAYAFVSGFTDAANAIATAVGTRAFTPLQAVLIAGVLELAGALTGTAVALTIGQGIVRSGALSPTGVCASLLATLSWSLFTFRRGIPVSETHGLVGGIIGAGIAVDGLGAVQWSALVPVLLGIVVSPLLGYCGAVILLVIIYRLFARTERGRMRPVFVNLQRLSAIFMAFSHGRNDAQKPMGILALAVAAHEGWPSLRVPLWIVASVALVASLGVASGGWRIIKTLGMRVTGLDPVQGFAAEASAASVLSLASEWGVPVSTTHAITSAIVGAGSVHGRRQVRWQLVAEISLSWLVTLPVSVLLGFGFGLVLGIVLPGP
jgi:inorganic phosphate transporter, PiT family